ncbi:MAG: hypothetical protein CR997_07305 [Acidobacteria bacterium]|nr:MAG: hypothetical protein CR997_07305 [Acidobacteriota bacterium]
MKERLQKIIARAGLASRRQAEKWIDEGRVKVNGQVISEQGFLADAEKDHIKVNGKLIQVANEFTYILLNKPKGVVSTVSDPEERVTVADLMKPVQERLFPVGRLDINTEGALLMTNDGELANKLTHPSAKCPKTYLVKVAGAPDAKDLARLEKGVTVDGMRYGSCKVKLLKKGNNSWLTVELREGKNHQIKNMFESVGHPVSKLRRIGFAFLSLSNIEVGQFRVLNQIEIDRLKRGDVEPLRPISAHRVLKKIGVEVPDETKKTRAPRTSKNRKPKAGRSFSDKRASDVSRRNRKDFGKEGRQERSDRKRSSRYMDDNSGSGSQGQRRDSRRKSWSDRDKKTSWKEGRRSRGSGGKAGSFRQDKVRKSYDRKG